MAKIEAIKFHKRNADLIVNGELVKGVNTEAVFKFALEAGEISEKRYAEFLAESDFLNCKAYLFAMLARSSRSVKEARTKLKEKGFRAVSINKAVALATEYGYLSDSEFAENYVATGSSVKGKYRLRRELQMRGVEESTISAALENSAEDEDAAATRVAEKFLRNKEPDEKLRERLFRHLIARGFSYDTIKKVLTGLGVNFDD